MDVTRRLFVSISISLTSCLALAACHRSPSEPAATSNAPPAANTGTTAAPSTPSQNIPVDPHAAFLPHRHDLNPHAGGMPAMPGMQPPAPRADDLAWDDPAGWQRVTPSSPMRRAQYRIPAVAGETGDAELTVITFGPGQGGDVDANLERWYGQITQPDGRASRDVATRRTFTVGSMPVTETEAAGRIGGSSMAMPGMPSSPTFEHGRLLAAIVETPQGPWFFKMTGPDQTVAAARPAFEAMLRSLHAGAHD
jgi:hypothetical protein